MLLCGMQAVVLVFSRQGEESSMGPGSAGLHLCVKLPMVGVCSGMNLCFTICQSVYFSRFWIAVWFSTSLQHHGSLWRYSPSTPHCLCQSPHGISFPRQKNTGMEQKLSLLKAVPCSHRNIYPDPYEIITLEPSCFLPPV